MTNILVSITHIDQDKYEYEQLEELILLDCGNATTDAELILIDGTKIVMHTSEWGSVYKVKE